MKKGMALGIIERLPTVNKAIIGNNTLKVGEPHPMARSALSWIVDSFTIPELTIQLEALSSCAIEGNRLGQICAETLRRVIGKVPVADRYLLGLAWYLRQAKEKEA